MKPIFDPSDSSVDTPFKGPIMIEINKKVPSIMGGGGNTDKIWTTCSLLSERFPKQI
jgi:hypothetical protein